MSQKWIKIKLYSRTDGRTLERQCLGLHRASRPKDQQATIEASLEKNMLASENQSHTHVTVLPHSGDGCEDVKCGCKHRAPDPCRRSCRTRYLASLPLPYIFLGELVTCLA